MFLWAMLGFFEWYTINLNLYISSQITEINLCDIAVPKVITYHLSAIGESNNTYIMPERWQGFCQTVTEIQTYSLSHLTGATEEEIYFQKQDCALEECRILLYPIATTA